MAIDRDAILQYIRSQGPVVPNDIKRALGLDPIILGAVLSELKGRGILEITSVKKGGSVFYYTAEIKERLEQLIPFLNPKDQVTVKRLQEEKVLNEANEELFTRVSFRNIPDFAKPFMVNTPQGQYRCWRYYLVSEGEARQLLTPKPAPQPELIVEAPKEEPTPVSQVDPTPQEETPKSQPIQHEQKQETKEVPKSEVKVSPKTQVPILDKKKETQSNLTITPSLEASAFYTKLIEYFSESDIKLHSEEQLAKEREYSFIVTTPTAVGPLKMYVHARNKQKLNEGDAAPALLKAKSLDLPCLFMYSGDFTKKALQIIEKEYKGIILKKIK